MQACLTGFSPQAADGSVFSGYITEQTPGGAQLTIHPDVAQWFGQNGWRRGYALWQQSRYCKSEFRGSLVPAMVEVCDSGSATPRADRCVDPRDSYDVLAMHRYMLQSIKSAWPHIEEPFAGWQIFPGDPEDYPKAVRSRFSAWPNAVLRAARLADMLPKIPYQEVVARWPTEVDFAHWLLCGTEPGEGGMAADALYPALLHNIDFGGGDGIDSQGKQLDSYLFWMTHGWLNRVWDKYRMVIGKMVSEPELQAHLIRQCRVLDSWSGHDARLVRSNVQARKSEALYIDGHLNPKYGDKLVRLVGEVVDIRVVEGRTFFRLDPRLVGVSPVWATTRARLNRSAINLSGHYLFVGRVKPFSGERQWALQVPAILFVDSIQSPK